MDQVPKILKSMVDEWTRDGFIVSFKVHNPFSSHPPTNPYPSSQQLETDASLLIPKSRAALERYGHQVVIGNDLNRRKFEVVFVSRNLLPPLSPNANPEITSSPADADFPENSPFQETWLSIDVPPDAPKPARNQVKEIEEDIVAELVRRHERWIER